MRPPDDVRLKPRLQVGDFPPTESASLHRQRCQFLRIRYRTDKTSRYLGVSRSGRRWRAVITNQERGLEGVGLGTFETEELAARAYDIVSLSSYGPEGTTNFPKEDYKQLRTEGARELVAYLAQGLPSELEEARAALAKVAAQVASRAEKRRERG